MKKIVLLLALCACAGKLMAQHTITPLLNNTLDNKLLQPIKTDSTWLIGPLTASTDKFLKQPDIDIKKTELDKKFLAMITNNSGGYNMPVIKTDGYSKMPVVRLEGNSKMPVAGKQAANKSFVPVNP